MWRNDTYTFYCKMYSLFFANEILGTSINDLLISSRPTTTHPYCIRFPTRETLSNVLSASCIKRRKSLLKLNLFWIEYIA